MIVRAVLAVVLAVAILGATLPAIDDARRDHTDAAVRSELDRLERSARGLLATDDPVESGDGARRVVQFRLPARGWDDAGVDSVAVEGIRNGTGARFAWTLRRGASRTRQIPGLPLRTVDGVPLVLRGAGHHRLVLSLDGTGGDPVVTVRRFTNQDGATGTHATVASDA